MDKFKLETSIQFPFLELDEIVSYSEVKKPSGIAYMILILIKESKDMTATLVSVLTNFGIPESLHYIFADTISNLVDDGILEVNLGSFIRKYFSSYRIENFSFTLKGKKIFEEECIPTGVTKEIKIPLFYNIALKELSLSMDSDLEPRPLKDSAITEDFINKFHCEKNVEDFVNRNKGVKIPIKENGKVIKTELIKKEEVVTNVEEQAKKNWIGKYDCTFILNEDSLDFEFENKVVEKFFYDNYTNEMINKSLSYKNKFNFKSFYKEGLYLSKFVNKELESILVPKEIDNILKQKGQLFITKGNYLASNSFTIESKEGLNLYDDCSEFLIVDQLDNKYAFIPGTFNFNSKLGTISIPLLLKLKVSLEELQSVLRPYILGLKSYSEENFKILVKISGISKDYDLAYKVLESYLNKDVESNIILLNEIKPTALMNANILKKYKELLLINYEEYLKTITEDNLETVLKISNMIPKFLNISTKDVLEKIFTYLKEPKNKIKVFEVLTQKGFNKETILLYVNPVEEALLNKNAKEKSLVDFLNYDTLIKDLKSLTHIVDYKNYSFDEENINKNEFKKKYVTAKSLQKNINYLKSQNIELFNEYDSFMEIFGTINDDFNLLEKAIENPKNINSELIENKIIEGQYQFVFVNLSTKLELILKNKFNLNGNLSDMLNEARRSGAIDELIIYDLHEFRLNRNVYIHPENRNPNFNPNDLRRWSKEIFSLEEAHKDESQGNN